MTGRVREVEPAESKRVLTERLRGVRIHGNNSGPIATGDDVTQNVVSGGTQNNVRVERGDYVQGTQDNRKVRVERGDYVQEKLDNRQGAFIEGGIVNGPVTGIVNNTYQGSQPTADPLAQLISDAEQIQARATKQGNAVLDDDLSTVITILKAAQKSTANPTRRQEKLTLAQRGL